MRDIDFNGLWELLAISLSYLLEVWPSWIFYIIGYCCVIYFTKTILQNIEAKVEESEDSRAKYRNIYPKIKQAIIDLRNSETKIFFLFFAGILIFGVKVKIFDQFEGVDEIPKELSKSMESLGIGTLVVYNLFINIIPNYSRFKTYRKLSKTLL